MATSSQSAGHSYQGNSVGPRLLLRARETLTAEPAERPETPPSPLSTVPFLRDPDYVHREWLVTEIRHKLSVPGARVALVGLGGVGKSQLAIEYAHQVRDVSPETWVFWLHASNAERFELSVRNTLEQLKVHGRDDPKANVFRLFRTWLRDEKERKWLIILDNADDVRFLLEPHPTLGRTESESDNEIYRSRQEEPCLDYLPMCSHGFMLITTRNELAALKMTERNNIVSVEVMEREHALALLGKKLGDEHSSRELLKLATELDFMPLAMTQAAAYILQRGPRCSVPKYVEKLEKNSKSKLNALEHSGEDLRRDREATNSILSTWQISFEHILSVRKSAAELLSLMSCFDRQAVPEALLRKRGTEPDEHAISGSESDHDIGDEANCDDQIDGSNSDNLSDDTSAVSAAESEEFEEDLVMLRAYAFISITTDPAAFEMHSLVQLATQRWLELRGWLVRWQSQFINNLETAFPVGSCENWAKCQWLFPHAALALDTRVTDQDARLQQASLLEKSGWYALEQGMYSKAKHMRAQSMKTRNQVLGEEHPDTLTSKSNLALAYQYLGQYDKAAELGEQVLEIGKRVLGEEHPDTLTSKSNLALAYQYLGQYDKAAELGEQVLEADKRVLGEEHPGTLTSKGNLALTYRYLGQYDKAAELGEQVLEIGKRVLGEEHPDTLTSKSNLANTQRGLGQHDLAIDLMMRSSELSLKVLGSRHPDCISRQQQAAAWADEYDDEDEENISGRSEHGSSNEDGGVDLA
ncbi:hypothetical protein Q7P37_009776 [Cladosporium fusiforme]